MKQGWEIKKLGDLCNLMTGGTPSRSHPEYFINGKIKWLVSGDIHKGEITDCDGRITEEAMANSNTKYLPINSVMIALNGQGKTRGTVAILKTKATCNQSLVSIYPKDLKIILPEYIFCNLHGRYEEIRRITGDDDKDRRGLNMPLLRSIEIPLPPLHEQQRIVSILNEVFAGIVKAKANAQHNLKNAKELFESYLQGVFENGNWEEKEFGEVINTLTDYHANGSYEILKVNVELSQTEDFAWMVRSTDFENNFENNFRYTDEKGYNFLSKSKVFGGEIIMSKIGNAGNVYLMPKVNRPCSLAMNLFLIRLDEKKAIPEYTFRYLKSKKGEMQIRSRLLGMATKTITKENVRNIIIPFPQIREQKAIVQKLDALSVETKKLEANYQQKINDLEELKKSILQKAFSGQLNYGGHAELKPVNSHKA